MRLILFPRHGARHHQYGGAAIEYVIVSTFATLLAIAAIAFVGKALKSKMQTMEEKLGVTFDSGALDLF